MHRYGDRTVHHISSGVARVLANELCVSGTASDSDIDKNSKASLTGICLLILPKHKHVVTATLILFIYFVNIKHAAKYHNRPAEH